MRVFTEVKKSMHHTMVVSKCLPDCQFQASSFIRKICVASDKETLKKLNVTYLNFSHIKKNNFHIFHFLHFQISFMLVLPFACNQHSLTVA